MHKHYSMFTRVVGTIIILLFLPFTFSSQEIQFELLDPQKSGFIFKNTLNEEKLKNPFNYVYSYNGGGVAIGDINNDGYLDIYMTANMSSSKLFLNKGNMQFEDISSSANVETTGWCTATSMVDINDDGWLDIYVCRSYHDQSSDRENLLFINNQDGTFSEKAKEYGINDSNYSNIASFFDYDLDGDLDLFVSNHPRYQLVPFSVHANYRKNPVRNFSNNLFRNNGDNTFSNVTVEAGLLDYSFSLGASTADYDQDGDPDLFISVDFDEPDVFLRNNGDGTFTDVISGLMNSTSRFSMGVDAGDINNDGKTDYVVSEMLNSTHFREKAEMAMMSINDFNFLVDSMKYTNFHMRNFLHLNTSMGSKNHFSDISRYAGMEKTDWSWSPLFIDVNNDGLQDLHITNGYFRDIINRDRKRELDSTLTTMGKDMRRINAAASFYARNCPQTKLPNFLFQNEGDLTFRDIKKESKTDQESISNGSAYGDLDNDGDLDLVINNLGDYSFIYENKSKVGNWLRLKLKDEKGRTTYGTKIILETKSGKKYYRELLNQRGFQSSSEPVVHFGLADENRVSSITITQPNQEVLTLGEEYLSKLINSTIEVDLSELRIDNSNPKKTPFNENNYLFTEVNPKSYGCDYRHYENAFNDYSVQILLPHKMSELGPFMSKGDANGDGKEDLLIGGSLGQPAHLYIQTEDGFELKIQENFIKDRFHEDAGSVFFDADGDGDQDLLIASGGYEYKDNIAYRPRLYLNDGLGNYKEKPAALGIWSASSSCVETHDFDNDGDIDLFIGARQNPGKYPFSGTSGLFLNDGNGNFTNRIKDICPQLESIGMVTDATWHDVNRDGFKDLVVVGEWMPITFLITENGKLINKTKDYFNTPQVGWWNTLEIADLDNDGFDDIVLGNLGLNYKFHASDEKPFIMYANDFDKSGSSDIALAKFEGDELYPVRGRACSAEQIPSIKNNFPKFDLFARASLEEIYGEGLNEAQKFEVNEFANIVLYGKKKGFEKRLLPKEAQLAPINGLILKDTDKNGGLDIIYTGNLFQSEIETGRADAGVGGIVYTNKSGQLISKNSLVNGFYTPGDVKSIIEIMHVSKKEELIFVANNNGFLQIFKRPKE